MNPATDPASNQPPPERTRIFLVDDHAVVRNGLKELLNQSGDLVVCGEASSADETLLKIDAARPDVAIIDLSLGEVNGLDLIKRLKELYPSLPMLVLSMHDESFYADRCLRAGAKGYIMKKEAIEQVEHAVRQILDGKVYLSESMSDALLLAVSRGEEPGSAISRLTDRELAVYELIGRGLGASEIAGKLRLSVKTIESYQAKLKEKLKLKDASELFRHALRWVELR